MSEAAPSTVPAPSLSPLQRIVAVFARPGSAWSGLETRVQWWIPLLIFLLVTTLISIALFNRAVLPMVLESFDRQVAEGTMSAEQATAGERMMSGPAGMAFTVVPQVVVIFLVFLLTALVTSLAVGFGLGGKLPFRLALEVTSWSSLVTLPGQFLMMALAWSRETMEGVHVGLGAFVPEPETPSRLLRGLAMFLDFLGPFSIWGLVVTIIGASVLSGVPRRKVAWTLSIVNVILWIVFSALSALLGPGASAS